jgi:hypothetical protein
MKLWKISSLIAVCLFTFAAGEKVYIDDFDSTQTSSRFVIEAENYSARTISTISGLYNVSGSTNIYTEGPLTGQLADNRPAAPRANYIETVGTITSGADSPLSTTYNGTIVDYKISITKPATYTLFCRWASYDGGGDSFFAASLNPEGQTFDPAVSYFAYHAATNGWKWQNIGLKNSTNITGAGQPDTAIWNITNPGTYTIRLFSRETRTAIDTIALQTTDLLDPTGLNLIESAYVPEPVTLAILGFGAALLKKRK